MDKSLTTDATDSKLCVACMLWREATDSTDRVLIIDVRLWADASDSRLWVLSTLMNEAVDSTDTVDMVEYTDVMGIYGQTPLEQAGPPT